MYVQTQTYDCQPELASQEPPSPWARRALNFLQACAQRGVGALSLDDFGPMFALAPHGELALTVDALCALDCLVLQEDGSFRVGRAVMELAPKPGLYSSTGGHFLQRHPLRETA